EAVRIKPTRLVSAAGYHYRLLPVTRFFWLFLFFPLLDPCCCWVVPPFVRLPGGGVLKSSFVSTKSGSRTSSPLDSSRRSAIIDSSATESLFHVTYAIFMKLAIASVICWRFSPWGS